MSSVHTLFLLFDGTLWVAVPRRSLITREGIFHLCESFCVFWLAIICHAATSCICDSNFESLQNQWPLMNSAGRTTHAVRVEFCHIARCAAALRKIWSSMCCRFPSWCCCAFLSAVISPLLEKNLLFLVFFFAFLPSTINPPVVILACKSPALSYVHLAHCFFHVLPQYSVHFLPVIQFRVVDVLESVRLRWLRLYSQGVELIASSLLWLSS